jgi:hypothetical protein
MTGVKGPHVSRSNILDTVNYWESIAAWRPRPNMLPDQNCEQQPDLQASVTTSEYRENKQEEAVQRRIRQSQINACFIGIFAILGVSLALANAAPNQEIAEVETLALLLIMLLIPFGCNRAGAVTTASILLTLLPTVALVATFTQPLPSGQTALTWTYDAGLAFAGLGALVSTLAFRPWAAWFLIGAGIILPLSLLIALMPHAPSLIGLDVAGGIIPSHWSARHQEQYVLYDFLFRPFLLIVLLGLTGTRMRRFMFQR